MDSSTVALSVIFVIVLASSIVGMYAGSRYKMDLEQWTVAGRGFGLVLVWLLMAGEIYTTFAFLGASGWAYSRGAPTLYIRNAAPGFATISWSPPAPGFHLQVSDSLSPPAWTDAPSGTNNPVTVPAVLPSRFYRLTNP